MFPVQYRKSERTTIDFCKFVLVKVPNFSLNWQAWIYGPNLPKKGALNQNKKSEQRHCILHIRISGCPKFQIKLTILIFWTKNIREFSWIPHRIMRFWFLLKLLFISTFFDILVSSSISRVFSSCFSSRWKSSWLGIPRTIIRCDYMN